MIERILKNCVARLCSVLYFVSSWAVNLTSVVKTADTWSTDTGQADLSDLSDEELVQICLARGMKDERPFRELLRRHQQTVWHTCYQFVQNTQDAEDLTQEVFFRAYRSLAQFAGRASFKTWLRRIAINTSQNELRRRSRRPQEEETPLEDMAEWLPARGGSSATDRAAQTPQEYLAEALATLQPEVYEVLQLKDLEQRPYAEVAQILGISQSAAKMRVQRARLALATAYQKLSGN